MALEVAEIENGTVVDHIPAGKGMIVYQLLNGSLNKSESVLLVNVNSSTHDKKDMVKMENIFVDGETGSIIALVAPEATINLIRNRKVSKKYKVQMPKKVRKYLRCLNPKCVTNAEREPLETAFTVSSNPVILRCDYCDKEYDERLVANI